MIDVYVSWAQIGECKVCHKQDDLRLGVCFDCCDYVDGKPLGHGVHKLWDRRNPSNEWLASDD